MIKLFSESKCQLGEGLFCNAESKDAFWFDINGNQLHWKRKNYKEVAPLTLENNPSCILDKIDNDLIILDAEGIKKLNVLTNEISTIQLIGHNIVNYRGNDGVRLQDGSFLFGTMERTPKNGTGKIYLLKNSSLLKLGSIGIPNTFIELDDAVLISDSLTQKIYRYSKLCYSRTLWLDFSNTAMTPDGGTLSHDGFIYICFWDGACIQKFEPNGNFIEKFELPVLRPTNCKFYSVDELLITSATEGMTSKQLVQYPESGKTLMLNVGNS